MYFEGLTPLRDDVPLSAPLVYTVCPSLCLRRKRLSQDDMQVTIVTIRAINGIEANRDAPSFARLNKSELSSLLLCTNSVRSLLCFGQKGSRSNVTKKFIV